LIIPLSIIILLVAIGVILWRVVPSKKTALVPALSGKPSLAIPYFENISSDKNLDAWKTGLTELLITKLAQSRFINVLDSNTVYGILTRLNLDEAKKYTNENPVRVGDEGGASHTLSGSLMKAGEKIIITMTLQKPRTGEVVSPIDVECNGEAEIILKIDEIANKIKSDLNLSSEQIAGDIDKEAAKITTSSPEAYKYYTEAIKRHLGGYDAEAIPLYERAVALDPGFAMAYRGLAAVWGNLGFLSKSRENHKKAYELKDRISEREAYIVQGQLYYLSEKTYGQAIATFEKMLDLYPDDQLANHYLGLIYHRLGEWDKAIEEYDKAQKVHLDRGNLGEVYAAKGLYKKARQILSEYPDDAV
jgi:tetratricopeptide (TPR) repeat protein